MSEIETVTPETPAEHPANTNTGKNGKPKKSAGHCVCDPHVPV